MPIDEATERSLRNMVAMLDTLPPSVTAFVPDETPGVVVTRTIEIPEGLHPMFVLEYFATHADARQRAAGFGIVAYGKAFKVTETEQHMAVEGVDLSIDRPSTRVRTQVVVVGPHVWGRTMWENPEEARALHLPVDEIATEDVMAHTPLTLFAREILVQARAEFHAGVDDA